ncbi:MAG: tetratricopeptide repeat protein [Desulfobacteraceae bacterium]|jgi:tetratricopeptide (TPR) repeat protein
MSDILLRVGSILLCLFLWTGCASEEEKMASHFKKGVAYFEKEEYGAAVIELRNVIKLNPEYIAAYLKLGEAYIRLGKYQLAYQQYSSVVGLDPSNIPGLFKLALFDLHSAKYDKARAHLNVVLAHKPNHLDALYALAAVHQAEKQFNQAALVFQQIIDIDQQQRPAYWGLANGWVSQGKLSQAETYFDQAAGIDSNGRPGDDDIAGGALAYKPRFIEVFNKMVNVHLEQENYDIALEKCDRQLARSGHSAKTNAAFYHMKGQILEQQSEHALAEHQYRRALEINPDYAPAANNLAYLLAKKDDNLEEALTLAKLASVAHPHRAAALDTLGWVYFRLGQYDHAIEKFRESLSEAPGHAIVHYHLGLAYDRTNQKTSAIDALEKALALDPNFPGADQVRQRLTTLRNRSTPKKLP